MAFFKLASFWSFDTDLQEKPLENPKSALENSLVKDGFINGWIKDGEDFFMPKPQNQKEKQLWSDSRMMNPANGRKLFYDVHKAFVQMPWGSNPQKHK